MRANKSPEPTVVGAGSLSERSRVVGRFESTVAQLSTLGCLRLWLYLLTSNGIQA